MNQAIASKTPVFGMLRKLISNGDIFVKALIVHAITDLNKFLNFQNIMTVSQIAETSEMILSDFNYLKIEDIRVCFGNGKRGHYGQLFARIDGQIIMLWLAQYSTDRTNEYLRIKDFNEKKALKQINRRDEMLFQKPVLEAMKAAIKQIDEVVKEKPIREKSSYEKLIQRFYLQFTKIVTGKNKRSLDESYRFIFMYGRSIDANEYVEFKISQHERVFKTGRRLNITNEDLNELMR